MSMVDKAKRLLPVFVSLSFASLLSSSLYAASPLETVLENFEAGGTHGALPVDAGNSSSGGASNTTIDSAYDAGSYRMRLTDADGVYNGACVTFSGALPQAGYYLITADIKVDNASAAIGSYGMAVAAGSPSTTKISDVNAGYVLNLSGTGDAALGYQTIGAALEVPADGSFPKDLTIYFGTDPSGNSYNGSAYEGNYNGTHRGGLSTWAAGSTNAVYIDNIKRIGPGNFGEERHAWISVGDAYTDLTKLENLLVQAKNNNFNCVDILARYRADAYYVPNRTDNTYANPEPFGTRVGGKSASATNDPLQYAVDRGHELGLKVYAAFSCFAVGDATDPYPSHLPAGSIMWYYNSGSPRAMTTSDPNAEGLWADPSRADVRNYTKNVLLDLVSNYDVDGVILDRIRYPDSNYSYNPQGLSDLGITGTPTPTDATFREARRNVITTFLHDCYEAVTTRKPWVVVGTAPIAYSDSFNDTYNAVLQFFPKWSSRLTGNRAISFGCCDLYQPQFYRLWNSTPAAPAANTTLMNKAQFGDVAIYGLDFGLLPGAFSAISPLFYHPTTGDTSQSNANAQNITDARALSMTGFGIFPATKTMADISAIRAPGASTAGVDVLASPSPTNDYLFKANYDNIAPNAVGSFNATPRADGTVLLSWSAPAAASDGESAASYLLYRSATTPVKEYRSNLLSATAIPGNATSFTVPTDFAGNYYYRIVALDDYNNHGPASEIGPISVVGEPTAPADVIVDNPAATMTCTWSTGSSATDKYGPSYSYKSAGTGSCTAVFSATLPLSGSWNVSEWHCVGTNRATNARHTILSDSGSNAVLVNQQVNGGKWNVLGQYEFTGDSDYSVTIDDQFSGTVVIADAIRWSYVVQAPTAPSNLAATAASQAQVNLSWSDNASNERNYIVARATTAGGPYTDIATLGINVTSYSDKSLSANTTYYYVVRASNSAGSSANSAEASVTTLPNAPAAPSALTASAASQTQINLTWTDNSTNESNIVVSRSATSGGPWTDIAVLAPNTTSYANTGLSAATTYFFVVRATNAGGSSAYSAQASATTLPNAPAAPSSLAASAISQTQVNLTWTDNSTNETNFVVARSTTSGGPYTDIATLGANVTSYSNTGLSAATTYYYVVRATNAGGASANAAQASATTLPGAPAAPSALTATAASSSQINLTWTDNAANESNFVVARSTTSGGPYTDIATLGANVTSYSNTGLSANTTYYYVVRATNAGGASANSAQASAKTLGGTPAAPTNLVATAASKSQVNLTWTDNATNESNYVVARSTTSGGPYTNIATLAANTVTYSNTGLSANTTYYYVVRATNASGASANSAQASALTWPADIIVDNANAGFSASTNWSTSTSATDKYGTNYRYRSTAAVSDSATWSFSVPQTRTYEVYAWWSQGTNRSKTAPYVVYYQGTSTTVSKNQQSGGGTWQTLGQFPMNSGSNSVKLSCWTTTGFVVVADAIKVVAR